MNSDQIEAEGNLDQLQLQLLEKFLISRLKCSVGEYPSWLNGYERGYNMAIKSVLDELNTHCEFFR